MIFSVFCIYKSIIIFYIKKHTHINIIHFWKVCSVEICFKLGVPSLHLNRAHFSGSIRGARQVKPASLTLSFLPASPTPRLGSGFHLAPAWVIAVPPAPFPWSSYPSQSPCALSTVIAPLLQMQRHKRGWIIPEGHTASAHGAGPGRLKQRDCGPVFTASLDVG